MRAEPILRIAAPSVLLAGVVSLCWAGLAPLAQESEPDRLIVVQPLDQPASPYGHDSLARVVVRRDLFRPDRRPAARAYDAVQPAVAAVPATPKPVLTLVGLIAGVDGSAVIEGLPGVDGSRVMRGGDVVAGLRLVRIERDVAVITGMDTTWVLSVRKPWQ
jgi:hypothetical protein